METVKYTTYVHNGQTVTKEKVIMVNAHGRISFRTPAVAQKILAAIRSSQEKRSTQPNKPLTRRELDGWRLASKDEITEAKELKEADPKKDWPLYLPSVSNPGYKIKAQANKELEAKDAEIAALKAALEAKEQERTATSKPLPPMPENDIEEKLPKRGRKPRKQAEPA